MGDGVNVASRIHELAPPGGSCISERVYEEIRNKPEFLGDCKRALERLEQAYRTDSSMLFFLKVDRLYDPLRSDPRFIALLKKVHLDK